MLSLLPWNVRALCVLLCALPLMLLPEQARALTNENCAGAMIIPGGGPFPYLAPVIPDITDLTNSVTPVPTCDSLVSRGVWFKFTPAQTGVYRFSVSPIETLTTVPMTVMALYSSTAPCTGLQQMNCSDSDGCLFTAEITTQLSGQSTYYICVWKFGAGAPAANECALQLRVSQPVMAAAPPLNDSGANAQVIPATGPFPYLSPPVDIAAATRESEPVAVCGIGNYSRGVWYQFRPVADGIYNFSTCYDTATTVCDTLMAVYASEGSYESRSGNALACSNDKAACDYRASATVALMGGTNYFVFVCDNDDLPPALDMTLLQLRVSPIQACIISGKRDEEANFQLEFSGIVESNYIIEASTDLKNWGTVGRAIGDHKGTNQFTDLNSGAFTNRSYRVTLP